MLFWYWVIGICVTFGIYSLFEKSGKQETVAGWTAGIMLIVAVLWPIGYLLRPINIDRGIEKRSTGERPLLAGESRDISQIEVSGSPGFVSRLLTGERIGVEIHNRSESHELALVQVRCTLYLKNGEPAEERRWQTKFRTKIPPQTSDSLSWSLSGLDYHKDDYARSYKGVRCEVVSGLLTAAPPAHPLIAVLDSSCNHVLFGSDKHRVQVENKAHRTVEQLEISCWDNGDWHSVTRLRRAGAPLREILPPKSTEWLELESPCIRRPHTCRIGEVKFLEGGAPK